MSANLPESDSAKRPQGEALALSDLYARYGLDERGYRYFGRYVAVCRHATVVETKRVLWRHRRVVEDLGWLIFTCDRNDNPPPALNLEDAAQLQADLAQAVAFCRQNP